MTRIIPLHLRYALIVLFICGFVSTSGFSQTNTSFQNPNQANGFNQSQFGQNGFNQNQYSQQQGGGFGSRFGSGASGQSRLSGRSSSRRSSRRGNDINSANPNASIQTTPDVRRTPTRRTSTPSGVTPPSSSGGASSGNISVHSGSTPAAGTAKPNTSRSIPKPNIKKKTYLYLQSNQLAPQVGEPFTVEIRLSGVANARFDSLGINLSYDPAVLLPVQGKGNNDEWLTANTVSTDFDLDAQSKFTTLNALMKKQKIRIDPTAKNQVIHQQGLIQMAIESTESFKAENLLIGKLTFVPLTPSKSTRINFTTQPDETGLHSTYLNLKSEDVLGSSNDLHDGVIPLDITIPSTFGSTEKIAWLKDVKESTQANTTLSLQLDNKNADIGDTVEMEVVLNNPSQLPVDDVEFLIVYNTRVLDIMSSNSLKQDGLFINEEKGILHYQGSIRKTKPDTETILSSIQFKATNPTTKTTFRVLVSKGSNQPTTGVYFKGQDMLGSSNNPSDGIQTTSLSIRPTVAYMQNLKNRM